MFHPTNASPFVADKSVLPYYASVIQISDDRIKLHSWAKQFTQDQLPSTFWDNIHVVKNESVTRNLRCDGDGSWIWQVSCQVLWSLSAMGHTWRRSPHIYARLPSWYTANLLKIHAIAQWLSPLNWKGVTVVRSLVESSPIVLRDAITGRMGPYPLVTEDCDNDC